MLVNGYQQWQWYTYAMLLSGIPNPVVCAVVILQTGVFAVGGFGLSGHFVLLFGCLVGWLCTCVGIDVDVDVSWKY